ncbi:MAG TPA: hypothetical protein VMI54_14280 [Polyangiaceae bacterium]|nr:hypothetical protein [Polyangiaceae bacterium]
MSDSARRAAVRRRSRVEGVRYQRLHAQGGHGTTLTLDVRSSLELSVWALVDRLREIHGVERVYPDAPE